ncbi:helix-turn-helix domain-containing protein [Actinomycetospora termitidis]|uniref:AraC family transcriptional regulator n=1 Tax=Actinomycetospora termitidis TaxID=3053470 RepID=A0ABT7M6E5_9PSEU|nr:AraC family transcriptional regulator [Actinomycetospora sp. Odt1-22]MDL5155819.1 AraC family transcriptional regulator [Actinomycetospora sp. Odt1-22]
MPLPGMVECHPYDVRSDAPGVHRGLPSPYLTFVVTIGEPLRLAVPDGGSVPFRVCLGGLHDTPEHIIDPGHQAGIHVAVHPLAARTLFGLPAAALAGDSYEAADVLGRVGAEIAERVDAAGTWPARIAVIDDVLGRLRAAHDERRRAEDEVRHAWRRIVGGRSVRETAHEVGWSPDHLARRFRAEVGVRPKTAGRMARFDRARRVIAARAVAGTLDLAGVAADLGYADQAHLAREFRALAGCSATRWVEEEVRSGLVGVETGVEIGGEIGFVQAPPDAGTPSSAA